MARLRSAKSASLALDRAADYMQEHGKAVRTYEDKRGRVCAIGAIRKVAREDAQLVATDALNLTLDGPSITIWSDGHDKRTVVRGLRRAARLLREGKWLL